MGASGVALKSKFPWRYACCDSLLFNIESRKIFRVSMACGMRQSHSDAGNFGSVIFKLENIFSSFDGMFRSIYSVDVWREYLILDLFLATFAFN